jgi:hypothetical protein
VGRSGGATDICRCLYSDRDLVTLKDEASPLNDYLTINAGEEVGIADGPLDGLWSLKGCRRVGETDELLKRREY